MPDNDPPAFPLALARLGLAGAMFTLAASWWVITRPFAVIAADDRLPAPDEHSGAVEGGQVVDLDAMREGK